MHCGRVREDEVLRRVKAAKVVVVVEHLIFVLRNDHLTDLQCLAQLIHDFQSSKKLRIEKEKDTWTASARDLASSRRSQSTRSELVKYFLEDPTHFLLFVSSPKEESLRRSYS